MTQFEKRVARNYRVELIGALAVYGVLLVVSIRYGRPMSEGPARTAILLSPMLGFGLAIWAMARQLARVDEYVRRVVLENIALAAAITAACTFSYGFLETAGFPLLSMFSVWMLMAGAWLVVTFLRMLGQR
jgi:hypothetical protein